MRSNASEISMRHLTMPSFSPIFLDSAQGPVNRSRPEAEWRKEHIAFSNAVQMHSIHHQRLEPAEVPANSVPVAE